MEQIKSSKGDNPLVQVYKGIEGIKEVYKDTLTLAPEDHLYAFLNPDNVHPDIYNWLTTDYVKERVEKNIHAVSFVSSKEKGSQGEAYKVNEKAELRETHFVDDFDFPFESEVIIYGGKIAFINFNPKAELVGIIINHPTIYETVKSFYLHYLWKVA